VSGKPSVETLASVLMHRAQLCTNSKTIEPAGQRCFKRERRNFTEGSGWRLAFDSCVDCSDSDCPLVMISCLRRHKRRLRSSSETPNGD